LGAFAQMGRIRILVAQQAVHSAPLAFEATWAAPTRSQHALAIHREGGILRIESGVTGAASYLTTCEAEAPKEWRERLAREAA
jgi:predicted secreted protein